MLFNVDYREGGYIIKNYTVGRLNISNNINNASFFLNIINIKIASVIIIKIDQSQFPVQYQTSAFICTFFFYLK